MDVELKEQKEQKVAEEYLSSLADLNVNSKPLINMLTILAEENIEYASVIVKVVEEHISKVHPDIKLPILYLIDSIVKNVKSTYIILFSQCIVNIFCGVFEQVNEKVRERMYTLRQTWNEVFAAQKLYTLDVKVNCMDRNWPITAKVTKSPSIHVNPNFFKKNEMEATLRVKTRELLELEKRKLELELEATKKLLQEQEKQLSKQTESVKSAAEVPRQNSVNNNQVGTVQNARDTTSYHNYQNTNIARQSQQNLANANITQAYSPGIPTQHVPQKLKVNPVNSSLLNTIRHRDPRLVRQQQRISQDKSSLTSSDVTKLKLNASSSASNSNPSIPIQTSSLNQNSVIQGPNSYKKVKLFDSRSSKSRENDRSVRERASRGEDRLSKYRNEEDFSDNCSASRIKSSLSTSTRNKRCATRSRSESKSPIRVKTSTRSNRSGSSTREKDKRLNNSKSIADKKVNKNADQKCSTIFPKIVEGVNVNKELEKKKSTPSLLSPSKNKEPKSKLSLIKSLKSYTTRKHKSRSPSPTNMKDTDLRNMRSDKRARPNNALSKKGSNMDKEMLIAPPPPILDSALTKKQFEENVSTGVISTLNFHNADIKPLTGDLTSKKIDQNLDSIQSVRDIDLRTFQTNASNAHQTTITSSAIVQSINVLEKSSESSTCSNITNKNDGKIADEVGAKVMHSEIDCSKEAMLVNMVGEKKRLSTDISDEPLAKRSRSGKIDGLFGPEDVDLRTVMPTAILKKSVEMTPPPPPVISHDNENWARVKGIVTKISPTKSNLDDVRAKLAKAAKFSKLDFMQKSNIFELQDETASQECNDSKIRTIISQAQELLENKSINEEQYNNLVKTVIQINETNKLNAAKRLESLNSNENLSEIESINTDQKAREAIHKKRIPKLQKEQQNSENLNDKEVDVLLDRINRDENTNLDVSVKKHIAEKEKRIKVSKWSAPVSHVNTIHSSAAQLQKVRSPFVGRLFNNRLLMPCPWQNPQNLFNGTQTQGHSTSTGSNSIPTMVVPKPCNSVDNPQADVVRTITIDGRTKEIRFYGDVAIVFMDWDQPREIGFQPGTRKITLDNKESIVLNFNENYKEVEIDGELHRVRFAFPSRELYIDEHWYEVYFGGPATPIPIKNKIHMLQAEGPPPQVHIGILRRDLVAGKINMIVDARNIIPVFLDADPQTFTLDGKQHVIEFADNLKTVVIDDEPLQVSYGGLPKSIVLDGRKYFIRFGALPAGIIPGQHIVKGMKYLKMLPSPNEKLLTPVSRTVSFAASQDSSEESTSSLPILASSHIMSNSVPTLPIVNIDELFQKLISTGIINTLSSNNSNMDSQSSKEVVLESKILKEPDPIKPINLDVTDSIKTRQTLIINTLFCGMQCSSCGVRFPPEQTIKYSQHLDWHFRQNRRERDSSRKAHSRKWYYEITDWIQYEEIEDFEDREKIFFESQQIDIERIDENSNQRAANSPVLSCPAEPGDVDRACDMCQEKFEQFYNEDLEEWHLRAAVRLDGKIYHTLCFEDYKTSLNSPDPKATLEGKNETRSSIDDINAVDITIVKTEDIKEIKSAISLIRDEDDDDDVIVVPVEEPIITEIEDDEEYVPLNLTQTTLGDKFKENEVQFCDAVESDVEIQEPHIPFTDLDNYDEHDFKVDENSKSPLIPVKIKEEPKDDDEYDDFEDVGTVLIPEDNVSVHSVDEKTEIQSGPAIISPIPSSPMKLDFFEDISQSKDSQNEETFAPIAYEHLETSVDDNLESLDNPLSTATSLIGVNKIKINMTKNIVTPNNSTSTNPTTKLNSLNQIEHKIFTTSSGNVSNISTIPVLCSGATTISVSSASPQVSLGDNSSFSGRPTLSCTPLLSPSNSSSPIGISSNTNVIQVITSHPVIGLINKDNMPSNIPVIGGNGNNTSGLSSFSENITSLPLVTTAVTSITSQEEPTFTFKAALENIQLKKMVKIERGLEASGLCSIM